MRTLTVQAYEDRSRPEGGHAVIVVHGIEGSDENLAFRLRPIENGREDASNAGWIDGSTAVSRRKTDEGVELTVGPEIADSEQLLPGTVVEIEFPKARARGEFLWPNIAPLLRPKRRSIVVSRGRRNGETRGERGGAEPGPDEPTAATTPGPASHESRADGETIADVVHAPLPVKIDNPEITPVAATAEPAPGDKKMPATETRPDQPDTPAGDPAAARPAATENVPHPPARQPGSRRDEAGATAHITADESWYESARGTHKVASEPAPSRRPQSGKASLATTAGILLATLGAVYMLTRQPGGHPAEGPAIAPVAVATPAVPSATALVAPAANPAPQAAAAPAASGTAGGAVAARGGGEPEPSLFDILSSGTTSPRGANAAGVDAAKALENANALLQGPGRDVEEGGFWLRRFLQSNLSDERTMRVLTQLGSTYAEPQGRAPDYVKARLLWEIASAAGDPVAMCFLGLVHENGLGTPRDKKAALLWYERSKKSGGCAQVDQSIARVKS